MQSVTINLYKHASVKVIINISYLMTFFITFPGDRIMSVAISFENMVYEDALTILSYASPYPVKITLQKEQQIPRNRKLSDIRTNLNHPLYRSQSVDALNGIPTESELSMSRRSTSAIRYDRRDSPQVKRTSKRNTFGENIIEESHGLSNSSSDVFDNTPTFSKVDALVHRENRDSGRLDFGASHESETDIHVDDSNHEKESDNAQQDNDAYMAVNGGFSDAFKNLTEEDKLDVLRLSYDDPDAITDSPFVGDNIEPTEVSEQKSAPVKPERKKKRSSTNSTPSHSDAECIGSPPLTPKDIVVDDVMNQELLPPTEAPPPIPIEAEEDIIQPERKTRSVTIEGGKITFEVMTPSKFDCENDKTLVDTSDLDASLNDRDTTLVARSPFVGRSDSPLGDEVEEDVIAPTQVQKDKSVPIVENVCIEKTKTKETLDNSEGREKSEIDFEKDILNLDMSLNFDADSILFKDSFPSRNTKETESGMAYDISVTELESMEEKVREDQISKLESGRGKGGIAFEVRDDYVNGETRTVNTNSVHRTASYDITSTHDRFIGRELSSNRPTSLKGPSKQDEGLGMFDWSGQRLVRSGSFTDIPQDDPVRDWTNKQILEDDDDNFEKRIKEDSKSPVLSPVTHDDLTSKTRDDSDSDSQCRSLSSSTSGEDIPNRIVFNTSTNGEDDGLGISPDNSPVKINPLADIRSDLISKAPEYNDSDQKITVELNSTLDTDMDC